MTLTDSLFNPESIAIIGASADPNRLGGRAMKYALGRGFAGRVYPVNPRYDEVQGKQSWPSIASLPEAIDLAVIAAPATVVPAILEECGQAHVTSAVVLSSGFRETGEVGAKLEREIHSIARHHGMLVCGPNSLGVLNFHTGMAASFSQGMRYDELMPGPLGIITQSGFLGTLLYVIAAQRGIGTSKYVSTGNETVLSFEDYLSAFAEDPQTRVIGGYVESIRNGRRLMDAVEKCLAAGKPVLILKGGRSSVGELAAQSHTAALSSSSEVALAALRQCGATIVEDEGHLIDVATLVSQIGNDKIGNLALLSFSGGAAIVLADLLESAEINIPELSEPTQVKLNEVLPDFASVRNPVDATGGSLVNPHVIVECGKFILNDHRIDALVVVLGMMKAEQEVLIESLTALRNEARKPVIVVWPAASDGVLKRLRRGGLVCFSHMGNAARAIASAHDDRSKGHASSRTVSNPVDSAAGKPSPLYILSESESREILTSRGLIGPRERTVTSQAEVVEAARDVGYPVVLKIESADIPHKSDSGGVVIGISNDADVENGYKQVMAAVGESHPEATISGIMVQEMVQDGVEFLVGVTRDRSFGHVLTIGAGGVEAELMRDVVRVISPFGETNIRHAIDQLRIRPLLDGYRGAARLDLDGLVNAVEVIGAAAIEEDIEEIEVNPLMVLPQGQGVRLVDALAVRSRHPDSESTVVHERGVGLRRANNACVANAPDW